MKILIKSLNIFLLGAWADIYKKRFDNAIDRCIRRGGNIAGKRLTRMSNKSYDLYIRFRECEKDLLYMLELRRAVGARRNRA